MTTLEEHKIAAIDFGKANGLVMSNGVAPFVLYPSPIDRNEFLKATKAQGLINKLYDCISRDPEFVLETLKHVEDPFTQKIVEVYRESVDSEYWQNFYLSFHRADYMEHTDRETGEKFLYQVEVNTISAAFSGLSPIISNLHKYLIETQDTGFSPENLPENNSLVNTALAIAKAHAIVDEDDSVILFIVQGGERNSTDQRLIEYQIWNDHRIKVIRRTLGDIGNRAEFSESGLLTIDGHTISVCYFRAGYQPKDYLTPDVEWAARVKIERSRSIKCPSVLNHLVGTKKMQQKLCEPGVIERFLENPEDVELVRSCFTGLYSLDPGFDRDIIEKVNLNPYNYVMKPQREGGGNLLTNEVMVEALNTFSEEELSAYILMDRIMPEPHQCHFYRNGEWSVEDAVSELGIYGSYLGDGVTEHLNIVCGTLLRSKSSSKEDGGVSAGVALLDSIYLS